MRLVLASTSRYRRALLGRLGVAFESAAPDCDEEALKPGLAHLDVPTRALHLARAKAQSVAARFPDAVILGSDQIAELDGEVLDKPGTPERALSQLTRLAGRTHRLHTAVTLLHAPTGRTDEHVDTTRLSLRALPPEALARYIERDAPLDCCGSYRIESLGIALFARVEGEDPTAIEGLPLMRVAAMLARVGLDALA